MIRVFTLVGIFLLFVAVYPVSADHRKDVLGTSTSNSYPQIPPTTEGPGLLLPDSPLFVLDTLKQHFRVVVAFTPENKAKVHAEIAGERLAELRFMLAKNNMNGVKTALDGISENLAQSAVHVRAIQLEGKNNTVLAKSLNDAIKSKQQALDVLEAQSKGEIKARVVAVQDSLMDSKVTVEDSLNPADLENEIRDDLERIALRRVMDTTYSVTALQKDLTDMERMASDSAEKSLKNREEAVKKAIESKNISLQKEQEKLLASERQKQSEIQKLSKSAVEEIRKTVQNAQEAATQFKQYQEKVKQTRGEDTPNTAVAGAATSTD